MSTSKEEPPRDLIAEARRLLTNCAPSGRISASHLFDWRAPDLLSSLCSALEEQQELNRVQAESIRCFQAQEKKFRSALDAAYRAIKSLPDAALGTDPTYGHFYRDELMANIEDAITPKGEQR